MWHIPVYHAPVTPEPDSRVRRLPFGACLEDARILWDFHAVGQEASCAADVIVCLGSYDLRVAVRCAQMLRRSMIASLIMKRAGVRLSLVSVGRLLAQLLYAIEDQIREQNLSGATKRPHRLTHSKPRVAAFCNWIDRQFERQGLLPSNPFTQALAYARERRLGLEVFLEDPDVPMDTNHLERALRVIPMGRRNWIFTWTELGARHVGIVQSLLTTCRLHEIHPYDYLVDVLQRVGQHPARVAELTPRLWKQHFAAAPLRSPPASRAPRWKRERGILEWLCCRRGSECSAGVPAGATRGIDPAARGAVPPNSRQTAPPAANLRTP